MKIKKHIEEIIIQLKQQPMNLDLRLELIQYYCIDGNWEKALKTVDQYLKINLKDEQSKYLFKNNILCEIKRLNTLTNIDQINFYTSEDQKISDLQHKIFELFTKNTPIADIENKFLSGFDEYQSYLKIQLHDKRILEGLWIDTDHRFSFIIEIFISDQYYWLPLMQIEKVIFKTNEYLSDTLWRRAEIFLKNGQQIAGFIPARYPITCHEKISDEIKQNKETIWTNKGSLSIGQGQKTWTNSSDDIGLLDIDMICSITNE